MAAGWPTKANYATGDVLSATNMNDLSGTVNYIDPTSATDGQVLTRDAASAGKVKWATAATVATSYGFTAGKNKIINGDFYINQRGFSSSTTSGYGFDRWENQFGGGTGTVTCSAQTFTLGSAPVTGYEGKNYLRCVTTGQSAAGTYTIIVQKMEDVRTYANQTITISFWAKAASGTPKIAVELTQSFGSGGSPSTAVNTYVGQSILSTSWARYTQTIAVPSISGKTIGTDTNSSCLNLNLWTSSGSTYDSRTGTLGIQSNTFDIWGVQVEAGSTATAFQTATGSIAGELQLAQRYYFKTIGSAAYADFATAYNPTTTNAGGVVAFPVQMRIAPTALETNGTAGDYNILHSSAGSPARTTCSSVPTFQVATPTGCRVYFTVASGLTAGNGSVIGAGNNTTAYLAWSAEL